MNHEIGHFEKVDGDLISKLSDNILSFILLFLSMRDALKTRLLSYRWRYLCSSSSNLHFDFLSILGINISDYHWRHMIFLSLVRTYVLNKLAEDLHELELLSLVLIPLRIVHILNASLALQKFQFAYVHDNGYHMVTKGRKLENKQPHLGLKEIEIFGFYGTSNEMEFVLYLLNNCVALKLLSLHT
eukprot:XP_025014023.1 uncharacterized protein LOC112535614 [Ricinus communis]